MISINMTVTGEQISLLMHTLKHKLGGLWNQTDVAIQFGLCALKRILSDLSRLPDPTGTCRDLVKLDTIPVKMNKTFTKSVVISLE